MDQVDEDADEGDEEDADLTMDLRCELNAAPNRSKHNLDVAEYAKLFNTSAKIANKELHTLHRRSWTLRLAFQDDVMKNLADCTNSTVLYRRNCHVRY